jgi:hypothetical protein
MTSDELRVVLLAAIGVAAGLWLLMTLVFRVSGTWERELSDDERELGTRPERIVLGQLGPFVKGRREVGGGYQDFSGLIIGPMLRLTRRDYGVTALKAQGFPESIAKLLDGEVMAKLTLRVRASNTRLEGEFVPQKVEFTHQPPRITEAYFLDPQVRRYRRVAAEEVGEKVDAWEQELTGEHAEA